ncbi:MAG: DMT family transporter [Pseudomonadota bacterium]
MNRAVLFGLLLFFGICWGGTIPLTKIAVSTGHSPLGLIAWQLVLAALILGVLVLVRRSRIRVSAGNLLFFTIVALTGTIVPNLFSYWASSQLPAGVMALVIALVPMCALLVALSFGLERLQSRRLLGVVLGICAIGLIVMPQSSLPDASKAWVVLVALIAPLCYGLEGSYLSVYQPREVGPIASLFGASCVGAILVVPTTVIMGQTVPAATFFQPGIAEWALIGSTLLHIIAYTGYIWMVKQAGPVFSAQVAYIVTPAGVLLAMIILGERPSPYLWAALIVLLLGLSLVQPRQTGQDEPAVATH